MERIPKTVGSLNDVENQYNTNNSKSGGGHVLLNSRKISRRDESAHCLSTAAIRRVGLTLSWRRSTD